MNDAEKLVSIPEEIIFQSYLQRTLDHLRIVYDPAFSSTELIGDRSTVSMAYGSFWGQLPEFIKEGENVLEFTEKLFPENGKVKNLGYLPFLAWFSVASRDDQMILDFNFPEGGVPVSPENMSHAGERFPSVHGVEDYNAFLTWLSFDWDFQDPLNLHGEPVKTYSKYQMAKALDGILDHNVAIVHPENTFLYIDVPDFYKRSEIYCTFDMKVTTDSGATLRETTSTVFLQKTYGEFGWFDVGGSLSARRTVFRANIYSESQLRYKYIVIALTSSNKNDYGTCRYDFFKSGFVLTGRYSVIYESPEWCTGNSVWEYEFREGDHPSDGSPDYVQINKPVVIVYPEYPDRLKELCKTQIERN